MISRCKANACLAIVIVLIVVVIALSAACADTASDGVYVHGDDICVCRQHVENIFLLERRGDAVNQQFSLFARHGRSRATRAVSSHSISSRPARHRCGISVCVDMLSDGH